MKGTIDVQIKHKDGSIETRHENNVVFDLPSLFFKHIAEQPLRFFDGYLPYIDTPQCISLFTLSTEPASLTAPKRIPDILKTTGGSSSAWDVAPLTRIVNSKNITMNATWTVNTPLTIKSIFVNGSSSGDNVSTSMAGGLYVDKYGTLFSKYNQFRESKNNANLQRALSVTDYSFTNNTRSRLFPRSTASYYDTSSYPYNVLDSTTGKMMYYDYPLANSSERFVYYNPTTGETIPAYGVGYLSGASLNNAGIRVINPETKATLREFPLSQFQNVVALNSRRCWLMHSDTKNWLLQSYTYTDPETSATSVKTRIWQIPDAATTETISYFSEDFGAGMTPVMNVEYIDEVYSKYFTIAHDGSYYAVTSLCKLNDDGTPTVLLSSGRKRATEYLRASYMCDEIRLFWAPYSTPSSLSERPRGGLYWPNLTAANFSTPIELAEGDVLTVSYKIEVA